MTYTVGAKGCFCTLPMIAAWCLGRVFGNFCVAFCVGVNAGMGMGFGGFLRWLSAQEDVPGEGYQTGLASSLADRAA